jgi:glycosyltransferase involved in cell wall biosynthesis
MSGLAPTTRVLVDARWLGLGGAGRATEYLLRGLGELQPPGRWLLWGTADLHRYAWPGAEVHETSRSPHWQPSQYAIPHMPAHDVALYMHQVRPLRPGRAVTLIHDTMQLRFGSTGWRRLAKRISHHLVARLSTSFITVSEFSKTTIERDLGIDGERLRVVRYPVDDEFAARVRHLHATSPGVDRALYVGQFADHKNLERLIAGFGKTSFAASGGELLLVGGDERWQDHLRRVASLTAPGASVTVEGAIAQERLEELYAASRLLAIPSLEEGFGLTAWEALSVGLPVCASAAGSLPEVTAGRATLCDPQSIQDIARALDEAASQPWGDGIAGPSMRDFAQEFVDEIAAVVSSERGRRSPLPVRG